MCGFFVQISYSKDYDLTCEITGKKGTKIPPTTTHISLPIPVFKPTMYFRGKLVAFHNVRKWYTVEYQDGPYLADESADGTILFKAPSRLVPKGGTVKFMANNVHQGHVTVDVYDNYTSHIPVFIILISIIQAGCFIYYVRYMMKDDEKLTNAAPIAGPDWMWMQSEFIHFLILAVLPC